MPPSQARIGHGSLLKRGNGASPEIFETIAEVTNINPPDTEGEDVKVSHMESPGGFHEYIPGMQEGGEVSFTINLIPAHPTHNSTTGLAADKRTRATKNWKIELAGNVATWAFSGYVKGFKVAIPVDDKVAADVTIKVTGEPTLTTTP